MKQLNTHILRWKYNYNLSYCYILYIWYIKLSSAGIDWARTLRICVSIENLIWKINTILDPAWLQKRGKNSLLKPEEVLGCERETQTLSYPWEGTAAQNFAFLFNFCLILLYESDRFHAKFNYSLKFTLCGSLLSTDPAKPCSTWVWKRISSLQKSPEGEIPISRKSPNFQIEF